MEVDAATLSDAETLCKSATLWLSLADSETEVDAAALSDAETLNESASL